MRQNSLFSSHFLDEQIQNSEEWKNIDKENVRVIKEIIDQNKDSLEKITEEEIKNKVIEPILEVLEHKWEKEVGKISNRPDFLFKDRNQEYAIAEAINQNLSLDKTSEAPKNPAYQVSEYLNNLDAEWGVLTNGKKWRLYYAEANDLNTFYEVDILKLVENGNIEDFNYFYNFFRKEAFLPKGSSFLEKAYEESIETEEV